MYFLGSRLTTISNQVKNQEVTIVRLREQIKEMEDKLEERAAVSPLTFTAGCFSSDDITHCMWDMMVCLSMFD